MNRVALLSLAAVAAATLCLSAPAEAQQRMRKVGSEKVRWYKHPPEYQIIDDRPVIKDFREAPASAPMIDLPPGPQGYGGGVRGGGAGSMPGDEGGGTLPAGGMPLGGGSEPGYRTDNPMMGPSALPKADFGHAQTNIPARGMGPRGPLPGGYTTNRLAGKLMPIAQQPVPNMLGNNNGMGRPATSMRARPAAPVAASYGGGYGAPSGGASYGGNGASTSVRATLLKQVK